MLQYLGIVLIAASWLGGGYIITRWHDKGLRTISRHAASNRQAFWLFAFILVVLGLFFYYWLVAWFTPHLGLSAAFVALLTVTILCQVLTGLMSDTAGWRKAIHHWAAYTMAVLYLPLGIFVICSTQLTVGVRLLCLILGIYMLVAFVMVVMMGKARHRFLLFQASYIVAFQLLILAAAYLPEL